MTWREELNGFSVNIGLIKWSHVIIHMYVKVVDYSQLLNVNLSLLPDKKTFLFLFINYLSV